MVIIIKTWILGLVLRIGTISLLNPTRITRVLSLPMTCCHVGIHVILENEVLGPYVEVVSPHFHALNG